MIAIVDYKAGNLRSVELAVGRVGYSSCVTNEAEDVERADRVIFPGVGAAGAAMAELERLKLDEAIRLAVREGKPVLGICLGTQVILDRSDEDGGTTCLGILAGGVKRFAERGAGDAARKIPHMGWNAVRLRRRHPVFEGVREGEEFYFVHSYYPAPAEERCVIGTTTYGVEFASVIGSGNLVAVQFHPERSGLAGLRVLENFLQWDGRDTC
ncbi:MAG: imidazole glycerol phosphate synthase subunit HisH [Planctomycetota bacterium]